MSSVKPATKARTTGAPRIGTASPGTKMQLIQDRRGCAIRVEYTLCQLAPTPGLEPLGHRRVKEANFLSTENALGHEALSGPPQDHLGDAAAHLQVVRNRGGELYELMVEKG